MRRHPVCLVLLVAAVQLLSGTALSQTTDPSQDQLVPDGYYAPDFFNFDESRQLTDMKNNPPWFNKKQCWFKGYNLIYRINDTVPYGEFHQDAAGFSYLISTKNMVISEIEGNHKVYVHSLWAYVQNPNITFDFAIFQKVSDHQYFVLRDRRQINTSSTAGIYRVDIGKRVKELGVQPCGSKDELCSVRVGIIMTGTGTSPIGWDDDGDSFNYNYEKEFTHAEVREGISGDKQLEDFKDRITKQFSIGALVCSSNFTQDNGTNPDPWTTPAPTAPTVKPTGTDDGNSKVIIIGAVLAAVVLILIIIIIACAVRRCKEAGRMPAAKSAEADFIRNMTVQQFDSSAMPMMLPNEVYSTGKTVSRATGIQMKNVMSAFDDGDLDPDRPVIYGNAALTRKAAAEIPDVETELQEVSEVPIQELEIKDELKGAMGKFASIWRADWKFGKSRQKVVVKQVRDKDIDRDIAVMEEKIKFLARLPPHPFVLGFIGPTTVGKDLPAMVMEFCEQGTLKSFLMRQRSKGGGQRRLTKEMKKALPRFCYEIAAALDFLNKRNIVHQRMCCRNVLLTRDLTCRVTGFGPVRDIDHADLERELCRWLAPECHNKQNNYTTASDVWMFGVTCWEVFSLGAMPYASVPTNDAVTETVRAGDIPPQPTHCPQDVYNESLLPCWRMAIEERPGFADLTAHLGRFAEANVPPSLHAHSYVSVRNPEGKDVLRPIPSIWLQGAFKKSMRGKKPGDLTTRDMTNLASGGWGDEPSSGPTPTVNHNGGDAYGMTHFAPVNSGEGDGRKYRRHQDDPKPVMRKPDSPPAVMAKPARTPSMISDMHSPTSPNGSVPNGGMNGFSHGFDAPIPMASPDGPAPPMPPPNGNVAPLPPRGNTLPHGGNGVFKPHGNGTLPHSPASRDTSTLPSGRPPVPVPNPAGSGISRKRSSSELTKSKALPPEPEQKPRVSFNMPSAGSPPANGGQGQVTLEDWVKTNGHGKY